MPSDYKLVAQTREANGDKQPKDKQPEDKPKSKQPADDGNRSRIVIEPAPESVPVPKKKEDELSPGYILRQKGQHIDRNIYDPFDKDYSKRPGAPEPIKSA